MVNPVTPPVPTSVLGLPAGTTPLSGAESVMVIQNGKNVVVPASGFSVVGPTGPAGATGPQGPTGPTGPAGGVANIVSGTTNQLGFYASNGQTLSPLTLGTNLSIAGSTLNASGGGSAALVFLGKVVTGGSVATVDLTSLMSSTYDTYIVYFYGVWPTSAGANLTMRVSLDNSTFISTSTYDWAQSSTNSGNTTTTGTNSASDTSLRIFPSSSTSSQSLAMAGEITLLNMNSSDGKYPSIRVMANGTDNGSNTRTTVQGFGVYEGGGVAIQAIRFLMSAGNIAANSNFYMYGVTKA